MFSNAVNYLIIQDLKNIVGQLSLEDKTGNLSIQFASFAQEHRMIISSKQS